MIWRKNIPGRGNSKDKSIEMRLRLEHLRKRESNCGWSMVKGREGGKYKEEGRDSCWKILQVRVKVWGLILIVFENNHSVLR